MTKKRTNIGKQKQPEHQWEDLLQNEFAKESDRACVILGAALLDSAIETVLKARLVPSPSASDSLFESPSAPLSSFSARIDFAHRIGLISARFARDLHLIRRIRNDFAHNVAGCSFGDSSVMGRVLELSRSHGLFKGPGGIRDSFPKGVRGEFQAAVSWMQWYLRRLIQDIDAIADPESEWGYDAFSADPPVGQDKTHTPSEGEDIPRLKP